MLRRLFHHMNRGMIVLWRLGLGRLTRVWPRVSGRIMVIEHTGRRTGALYRAPVNYTTIGEDLYCVAAFGDRTDWYRNLMARPRTTVWLPAGRWEADAEDVSGDPQRLTFIRAVLVDSGFAAPLFGIHPRRISDADLASVTEGYRLVRIRLSGSVSETARSDDLSWIWILVTAAIVVGLRQRTNRRTLWPPSVGN